MKRAALAAIVAVSLFVSPAGGLTLWQWGEASLDVSGSVRELALATHGTSFARFNQAITETLPSDVCVSAAAFPDCPAFRVVGEQGVWQTLTRLRTRANLQLTPRISATLVYDHELLVGVLGTLENNLAGGLGASPFVDLEQQIVEFDFGGAADEGQWRHLLYRAHLTYQSDRAEVIIGRQRIPWGVGRLWSPMDRLNFIPPLAIEGDQSPGVDAIDAKWLVSGFTHLEAVLAPQDRFRDSAAALRAHGVVRDIDYSMVAGIIREAPTVGVDFAGNLGDAALRLEAVYTDPEHDVWPIGADRPRELAAFWQVVVSADRNFDLGTGVYVLLEHLYNGNDLGFGRGLAGPLLPLFEATETPPPGLQPDLTEVIGPPFVTTASVDRLGGSRVVSGGRHLTGLQFGYDFFPLLHGDLVCLYDWDGESVAVAPLVRYEPFEFLEITLGGHVFAGSRLSEYGSADNLVFLLAEFFF